ncbi:MAG: succinate dehydrogenase assembly factor 2 [Hyphomicrobiales bacterium]|nr:succinate dehydrogenase assembly factor 2 [Hyphomicrobiales bacterium]
MSDTDNTQDARKKKAIWRAEHRGIREMDLLMGSFARQHVPDMDDASLADFEALITVADPDLYNWLLGRTDVPEEFRTPVYERLRRHRPEIS